MEKLSAAEWVDDAYFNWYNETRWKGLWNGSALIIAKRILADGSGSRPLGFLPANKGNAGGYDVWYSVFDLYDTGRVWIKKRSIRTKYGSKDDYAACGSKPPKRRGHSMSYADVGLKTTRWARQLSKSDSHTQ